MNTTEDLRNWIEFQTKSITDQLKQIRDIHNKVLDDHQSQLRIQSVKIRGILAELESHEK